MSETARSSIHNTAAHLLGLLADEGRGTVNLVQQSDRGWIALEEASDGITFAEAEGSVLKIVPFGGDTAVAESRPFVISVGPSWLDGSDEITIDLGRLRSDGERDEVLGYLRAAFAVWRPKRHATPPVPSPTPVAPDPVDSSANDEVFAPPGPGATPTVEEALAIARMGADVAPQWSWASSAARIPQIDALTIDLAEPAHVRVAVFVHDADLDYGRAAPFEGHLDAGTHVLGPVAVALSARTMSQVEERRGARCSIELVDATRGVVLARVDEEIDIQPRDLWLALGDPRSSEQGERLVNRHNELLDLLQTDPENPSVEAWEGERKVLRDAFDRRNRAATGVLGRSLLASFVRPNHPEVARIAREAADRLLRSTGDGRFFAFQLEDPAAAEARVDQSVTAVYDALAARKISYSEPPPGWDYYASGQRIRDHSEVACAGLGTCMDTTVLMGAVLEQVGLLPVLVLVPKHIFVGYWRSDPEGAGQSRPDWYPDAPVIQDLATIRNLVEGGRLGLIETTAFAEDSPPTASEAREHARHGGLESGYADPDKLVLIDVAATRRSGVSPLPAVTHRDDGVTEVVEYRPGNHPAPVIEVERTDHEVHERQVDNHPARYRTWKSSLFSLNATNDLLSLKSNARVQQVALPSEGLAVLEDRLNQDKSFSLHSGLELPEVWHARGIRGASQMAESEDRETRRELLDHLDQRKLYVQRKGRSRGQEGWMSAATTVRELRSMAHAAKTSRDERGMNPLFLCLGLLRWQPKPGTVAEAPLILVPVDLKVARGRKDFTLSLDTSQHTSPNVALIELLKRNYGLTIPGLAEPIADRAGIDVDAVLAEVRTAIAQGGHDLGVVAQARLATLDLSAFRMWQDLNTRADTFLDRPLIRHLVDTPADPYVDPVHERLAAAATAEAVEEAVESLETPIPADATQKRAVVWARQGRSFVLQGPPGTGKSQTITNMVAECLLSGMRVLFVAEKGTALTVVQRRLDSIGLGPFTLNLHHEGSNATEVRKQLKLSLNATVVPDKAAMEGARRRWRSASFELARYPDELHRVNAVGLSAYTAHDELLVLGDGPTMAIPRSVVVGGAEEAATLGTVLDDLQPYAAAAGVRARHPWRFAGPGRADPFDVAAVSQAVRGLLDAVEALSQVSGPLSDLLGEATWPDQLHTLAVAADPALPRSAELRGILDAQWSRRAEATIRECERGVGEWRDRLHGFDPRVLELDLRRIAADVDAADRSGFLGRSKRQIVAFAPLAAVAPPGREITAQTAGPLVRDLAAVQDVAHRMTASLRTLPGLADRAGANPFAAGTLDRLRARVSELTTLTAALRGGDDWAARVRDLATGSDDVTTHAGLLSSYAEAWRVLREELVVADADLHAWLGGESLVVATTRNADEWRRHAEQERLLPLQQYCRLVGKLEPLRKLGLDAARDDLLEARLPAYVAEDGLARGLAQASLEERITAAGLDRFDGVAHDQRVIGYAAAQASIRTQWGTDGPDRLLAARGSAGGAGGLARELEKTTRKLGTRAILRKYGRVVQDLTPLTLCSPASVVDLIEPGVMEFDVVIFDEASQITVPEAVGALGRARAAIVVGDTKQMPPTRKVGGGQTDEEVDDPDVGEIVEDQESILSECELAQVPTLTLSWHYRSQDEALIAFSNRTYYRGELSSFPTPTLLSSDTGVEFRRVDGQYLRAGSTGLEVNGVPAGSNTNPVEATAIVEIVRDLLGPDAHKAPTIGIVTFNEQQRSLIEELLHADTDPRIAQVMDEGRMGRGDVLFVKALEQVQGDERDVILFSIAFSKQANGKIPTNFGPLTNSGGERRLNVAVTRARRKNIVVCSFEPAELDVAGSSYQGPKDLKDFLTFTKTSTTAGGDVTADSPTSVRDRHRDDVAAALRAAGFGVMVDVGMSTFKIDLVLARPETPERPLLPVLLDGESWKRRTTVSDRDVLPVEVLQHVMGWPAVARIWWPMWQQNRDDVVRQIAAEVDRVEDLIGSGSPTAGPVEPGQGPATGPPDDEPSFENETSADLSGVEMPMRGAPASAMPVESMPVASIVEPAPVEVIPPIVENGDQSENRLPEFVAAHSELVGSRDVLDALPDRVATAQVKAEVLDIIETEGPIEMARLTRLVARRFGLSSVRAARAEQISRLVPRDSVRRSQLGVFAWPDAVDPSTWTGFRIIGPEDNRGMHEIAPEEAANAMRAVLDEYPGIEELAVFRMTAELLLGVTRLSASARGQLAAVRDHFLADRPSWKG